MKNRLYDLNNYLFAQLERLDDEGITGEELSEVIERGKAIADVAAQIIANSNLQLKALTVASEFCGMDIKKEALVLLKGKQDESAEI